MLLTSLMIEPVMSQNLFNDNTFTALTADHKAHAVGDILTVLVLQNSQASSEANLATNKNFNLNAEASFNDSNQKLGAGIGASDSGTGQTSRGGNIKAVLTVKIKEINANGSYEIAGSQDITINGEIQSLKIKGSVRAIDIAADNTVLSTQIADAKISYTGDGALSEAQRHGIIYRFLSFLGLV